MWFYKLWFRWKHTWKMEELVDGYGGKCKSNFAIIKMDKKLIRMTKLPAGGWTPELTSDIYSPGPLEKKFLS